jgi:putative intracellular protease/amidase
MRIPGFTLFVGTKRDIQLACCATYFRCLNFFGVRRNVAVKGRSGEYILPVNTKVTDAAVTANGCYSVSLLHHFRWSRHATGNAMKPLKIIMPIPNHDFDPTEVAISWLIMRDAGHTVDFATPDGKPGQADPMMLSGEGLDPWAWFPVLGKIRLVGLLLRADRFGRQAYRELQRDARFQHPQTYATLRVDDYDGMVLAGGHAKGMRPYLESKLLQDFVARFFDTTDAQNRHKPIAAICHGVVLAARSLSGKTGKSVLYGRKTTSLTWKQESTAWRLSKYLIRFWDAGYYRTYEEAPGEPVGYRSVEMEIKRALAAECDFLDVPPDAPDYSAKTNGIARDRIGDARPAWVVQDGSYISARWPGDAHTFAREFVKLLAQRYASA